MKRTMITVASWLYTLHNDSLYIYTLLYTASTFSQKSSLQHLDQVTEEDPTRRRHGLVRRRPSGHRGRRPHWARGHRRSRHSRVRRGRTILLGEAENHRKFKLNIGLAMAANRKIILHSFNFWFGKSTSYGWCSQLSTSIHLGDIPWPSMATFNLPESPHEQIRGPSPGWVYHQHLDPEAAEWLKQPVPGSSVASWPSPWENQPCG